MATIAILQIINKAAIIDVNLVKKVPIDLADVKFSCETPRPKAPPSDRCNKITITKITANAMLTKMSNDVHDMGTNQTMLAAKIANYLYKKGSATTMEVAVTTEESITDSVISELRRRIS